MQNAQALPHTLYRGERMPNIIQTLKYGNTTVHIASDYMLSGEALEKAHDGWSQANYAVWDSLTDEEREELIREEDKNEYGSTREIRQNANRPN